MAIVFVTANAHTNNVIGANQFIPSYIDHNAFTTILDDTDTGVKDLMQNINSHTLDQIMTGKPYINAYYDGTNVIGTLINAIGTFNEATISILGTSFKVSITNNQFVFPIKIHSAIMNQRITITLRIDGFPYSSIEVGGANGDIPIQLYQDNTGIYNIVPLKNADLANYYQNSLVDMVWSEADIATITGILAHTLFHYVLPNLSNQTYTPLTLTISEQNGFTDIQNNILPTIATTLQNVIPDGVNADIHYNSYRLHIQQAKQAMDKYVADRIEISKYVQLQ